MRNEGWGMRNENRVNAVRRFGDLLAWQRARELTRLIYEVTREGAFARGFGLASQAQRAAVSIAANIAEGFERGSRAEFHRFLPTAKASCAELRTHLYIALDVGYLDQSQFASLFALADEVGRLVGGLRAAVAR